MKHKNFLFLVALIFVSNLSFAQIFKPCNWSQTVTAVNGDEVTVEFKATLDDNWAIYSQNIGDDGPVPTSFVFDESAAFKPIGEAKESTKNRLEGFDEMFEMQVIKYKKQATFTQKFKVLDFSKPISGYVEFMVCDDARCLPPTEHEFSFPVKKKNEVVTPSPPKNVEKKVEEKVVQKPQQPSTPVYTPKQTEKPPLRNNEEEVLRKKKEYQLAQQEKARKEAAAKEAAAKAKAKKEAAKAAAIAKQKATPKKEPTKDSKVVTSTKGEPSPQNTSLKETLTAQIEPLTIKPATDNIFEPYAWTGDVRKIDDQTYDLRFFVKLGEEWNIYSQFLSEDGPVPTSILFTDEEGITKVGEPTELGIKEKDGFDEFFEVDVKKFFEGAVFSQKIKLDNPNTTIDGEIEFMVCDKERCLPPTGVSFSLNAKAGTLTVGNEASIENLSNLSDQEELYGGVYPKEMANVLDYGATPDGACNDKILGTTNFVKLFILGFLGGLVALLTPCVFPMIPLTVSFFTKSSGSKSKGLRDASLYGGFIALVYVLFSIPFHLLGSIDPNIFNDISTNVPLNIFFFVIFVVFAISFFGYFEITLPSSWQNKSASAEGSGGILGIFFMALTLALVSFSCTGPILGSLLAGALTSQGGAWQLTAGLGGFGVALALPFTLFAAFPGMMKTLPKSGGWMTTVKVVLGFIELALALKFLSNADLVLHSGYLKIELFLGLWILIAIGLALYLFGFIKFPHDGPIKKLSPVRMGLGVLSMLFAGYLATGFTFNEKSNSLSSLTLLSGFAPPACYSYLYPCDCPQNLDCYKDLEVGLAVAKEQKKPILLDFTGHACVNCRKMEENVWPQKEVYGKLKDDYVLISLYVDEKISIPEDEQIKVTSRLDGREVTFRTTGKKWSFFQAEYFKNNSQPFYVLMSPEGELLNEPAGYMPDPKEYAEFLQCGINNFKSKKILSKVD